MLLAALLTAAAAAVAAAAYDPELNWPNPRAGIVEQELSMAVDNRGRLLPVAAVNIFGLTRPVSVHWDVPPNGQPNILIAEKIGVIRIAHSWIGQPAGVLIDISERVASWGDHGLTGLELHDGFLWVTYMVARAPWGQQGCTDHGQLEGRENDLASVQGCPISGRVSRFPYAAGAITGPEEVVVDGASYGYCCQFSTHSVASPKLHDDGSGPAIYVEWGDGAAFALVDAGFLGLNPCNDTAPFLGAFRSQDPSRLNGKVIKIDPVTLSWSIVSSGHRNGYRLTSHTGKDGVARLYDTDTGWYTYEEVNHVLPGKNFGWPCNEGPFPAGEYRDQAVWAAVCGGRTFDPPAIAYEHPVPPPPGNVMSVSAVGGNPENGRLYYGDYTQGWVKSVDDLTYADERTEAVDAFPVEIRYSPLGLVIVDHTHGLIRSLPTTGTLFSPSSSAAPPFAAIRTLPNASLVWAPTTVAGASNGSATTTMLFISEQNVEGREGANFEWSATLNYDCIPVNDSCFSMPLRATGQLGGKNFTLQLPQHPGTIEVSLDVRTYGGFGATAQRLYAASLGAAACTCSGNRTITTAFLGTPSRTPSPSRGWRAAAAAAAKKPAGGVDTKSPLFIGLVSAGATLVAIALVVAALYASGAGATLLGRLGGGGGGGGDGGALTRPLRRPTTRSAAGSADSAPSAADEPRKLAGTAASSSAGGAGAATGADAAAPAAAAPAAAAAATPAGVAGAGTGMAASAATATSAVAARRAAANITPLDAPAGGGGSSSAASSSAGGGHAVADSAAAAPSRPSPAEKAQSSRTPSGARRV